MWNNAIRKSVWEVARRVKGHKIFTGVSGAALFSLLYAEEKMRQKNWWSIPPVFLMCLFFLYISVTTLYIYQNRKNTEIRIIEGVKRETVFFDDFRKIMAADLTGIVLAAVAFIIYHIAQGNLSRILRNWRRSAFMILLILLIEAGTAAGLLLFIRKKKKFLIARKSISGKAMRMMLLLQGASIVFTMACIPHIHTALSASYINYRSASLWKRTGSAVQLSFSSRTPLYGKKYFGAEHGFIAQMEKEHNSGLSMLMDSEMVLSEEELGPYDHIVFADAGGMKLGADESNVPLEEVKFDRIYEPTRNMLRKILKINLSDESLHSSGIRFYELRRKQTFAALDSRGDFHFCHHPLIIFASRPSAAFDTKSFLYPAVSTGNIFFYDENKVRQGLRKWHLDGSYYPGAIDIGNIRQNKLLLARIYWRDSIFSLLDGAILLAVFASVSACQAFEWTNYHREQIFALYTNGVSYEKIVRKPVFRAGIFSAALTTAAGIVLYIFYETSLWYAFLIFLLYVMTYYLACRKNASRVVFMIVRREM